MSFFGNDVSRLLTSKGITATELARVAGISEAHISKIKAGLQIWVSPETFDGICFAISQDEDVHALLLRSFLLDQCDGRPGADRVEIRINGKRAAVMKDAAATIPPTLPSDMQSDFVVLMREAEFDSDLRQLIRSLRKLIAPESPRE